MFLTHAKLAPATRRRFPRSAWRLWRVSKVGVAHDVRIAVGSVAPVPLRLSETERILEAKAIEPSLVTLARKTALAEIQPIDDIRSTARYRAAVVGNLVAEFLEKLRASAMGHE